MNIVRTTTLAIGASLIGSSLYIALTKPDALSSFILGLGFVFLLHGAGFLQEYIIGKSLRWYRTKKPFIGIIHDMPYSGYGHVWSKMSPNEWLSRINDSLNKSQIKARVKLIRITKPWRIWFIDRYLVIINPYGPRYPEIDIENLNVMKSILHFVHNGGVFVNVADIPFFFPFDIKRGILYCPTGKGLPHYYKAIMHKLYQLLGIKEYQQPIPGYDSPFSNSVMVDILATEVNRFNPETGNIERLGKQISLKLKNKDLVLQDVAIHRGIICTNHVESVVEELDWEKDGAVVPFTPFCYIHYGKGKILASLIWLDEQTEDIREKITDLQCDLIIEEVRNTLRKASPRTSYICPII